MFSSGFNYNVKERKSKVFGNANYHTRTLLPLDSTQTEETEIYLVHTIDSITSETISHHTIK